MSSRTHLRKIPSCCFLLTLHNQSRFTGYSLRLQGTAVKHILKIADKTDKSTELQQNSNILRSSFAIFEKLFYRHYFIDKANKIPNIIYIKSLISDFLLPVDILFIFKGFSVTLPVTCSVIASVRGICHLRFIYFSQLQRSRKDSGIPDAVLPGG